MANTSEGLFNRDGVIASCRPCTLHLSAPARRRRAVTLSCKCCPARVPRRQTGREWAACGKLLHQPAGHAAAGRHGGGGARRDASGWWRGAPGPAAHSPTAPTDDASAGCDPCAVCCHRTWPGVKPWNAGEYAPALVAHMHRCPCPCTSACARAGVRNKRCLLSAQYLFIISLLVPLPCLLLASAHLSRTAWLAAAVPPTRCSCPSPSRCACPTARQWCSQSRCRPSLLPPSATVSACSVLRTVPGPLPSSHCRRMPRPLLRQALCLAVL